MEDRYTELRVILDREVHQIKDPVVKEITESVLEKVPVDNWTKRASKKYHPEDERGYCGNLLHTLRVIRVGKLFLLGIKHTSLEYDFYTSGATLHDAFRYGEDGRSEYTIPDHAKIAGEAIEEAISNCNNLYPEIHDALEEVLVPIVSGHMGKWEKEPVYLPELGGTLCLDSLLVLADHIAAQDWISIEVR